MFIPLISNRCDSKKSRGGKSSGSGASRSSGRGLSNDRKSPTRASGSTSGHTFTTSLPSPDCSILRHVLDVPDVPHHIPKARNAMFASERAAKVDMDLQHRTSHGGAIGSIVVSAKEAMAISRRQFDDVDEKETLKHDLDPRAVEYNVAEEASVSSPSSEVLLPLCNPNIGATNSHPRSPTIDEAPAFLSFKRRRTSNSVSSHTSFDGDSLSINSSSTTLPLDKYKDARCSSLSLLPSPTISLQTSLRELGLHSTYHNDVRHPPLLPLAREATDDCLGNKRGTAILCPTWSSRASEEQAETAGSSTILPRSKLLDSMFNYSVWEKEGDGETSTLIRKTIAGTTSEQNPSTETFFQTHGLSAPYGSGSVPATITASSSHPAVVPACDGGTSMPEGLQGNGRRIGAKHNNFEMQNLWRVLKAKIANHRHSSMAARRLRLSRSSHALLQRCKSLSFARLFARLSSRSNNVCEGHSPPVTTIQAPPDGPTVAPAPYKCRASMAKKLQTDRRNISIRRKVRARGSPKSLHEAYEKSIKRFIEYPKE